MFHAFANNPIKYKDPDGRWDAYSFYNATSEAFKVEMGIVAADSSVPEPTDAIPVKWIAYVIVLGGTALATGVGALVCYLQKDDGVKTVLPPGYTTNGNGLIVGPNGTTVPSFSDAWDQYNGNDIYISNPKHNQNAKGNVSREPANAEKMFEQSVRDTRKGHETTRWYRDRNGFFHRFQGSNHEYHWNGSTASGMRIEEVPIELRRSLPYGEF